MPQISLWFYGEHKLKKNNKEKSDSLHFICSYLWVPFQNSYIKLESHFGEKVTKSVAENFAYCFFSIYF